MFFDTLSEARAYAASQTIDLRGRKHIAVKCRQWSFCRQTGEYNLQPCYMVKLA